MSSSTGSGYLSFLREAFNGLGSMQIVRAPDFLTTTARLLTHGVGSSIGDMTPSCCSRSNSFFSLCLRAVGTRRGGATTRVGPSSTSRCTVPGSVPNSL